MKTRIQQVHDRGSREMNEDELLVRGNLFAVFDGATSLTGFVNSRGETGGRIAAGIAREAFSGNGRPLKELAIEANQEILKSMKREGIDTKKKEALWSTAAAALRILDNRAEYLTIGDCLILQIRKDGSFGLVTPYFNHDLETMIKWKELADRRVMNIRKELDSQLRKVRREMNIKYGNLSGEKEAIRFLRTGSISLADTKSLILFTDGLFIPKEDPEAPEDWELFSKLYQESGLEGILRHVRSLEKADPECWKYIRFKQHDDAAAIGIDFQ
jgi:serine/threonine protein phosphatase PrpC